MAAFETTSAYAMELPTAINNEKLISCVASRTSLWLAMHKDHKNWQLEGALWKEICAAMFGGNVSEGTYGWLRRPA